MIITKTILSLVIASTGLYFLIHAKKISQKLQDFFVESAEKNKGSGLFFPSPEKWKKPFMIFIFRAQIIFLGILLLIIAYPIVFGPIIL